MNFHDIQFPSRLSFGSVGGPERRTEIVTLTNGFEERNTPWAESRRRYDAGIGLRSLDDIERLVAFFEARRGQLYGFRWKDWSDYKSCLPSGTLRYDDQVIAQGDGKATEFQLIKTYRSGPSSYARPITKPVQGAVRVGIQDDEQRDGIDYTVDPATGIVTFVRPPLLNAEISAGYEYDVPVRFDTDRIQTSVASFQAGEVPNVPVVEVRV
ncbi:DUF2460 domain-containing protein [Puniceibacterium sp. IMCC21224]|uniref:DUF2460 domain-containing protein n=1 Tax=Puniceibacterium sp. IMCC21224 TaxID=1618204 RepID=UPI00064DCE60|nr:DUF2460 domain-containing protein [Puniceibacterium sp. IMCC21224]KMK67704.1 TIGR02217 family protein [Puniceibacterium sp. IMCC21224]